MSLSEMHLNYLIKILKLNIYESFLADITFVFMRKGESFGVSNCKSARSIEIAMKSVENSVNRKFVFSRLSTQILFEFQKFYNFEI